MNDQVGGSQPFDQCWIKGGVCTVAEHAAAGANTERKRRNTVNRSPAFDGKWSAQDRLRWIQVDKLKVIFELFTIRRFVRVRLHELHPSGQKPVPERTEASGCMREFSSPTSAKKEK